ncbi:YaeQ family protein [Anaeromyxobacter oryzae]|uniref:YaeQ family protein n=1 Tax=Anaeromyxobacter oryzae TaxID=2918170 RepID=A0ABN6MW83_9BACT|nr:YaeQ family protein [Anaeromyxobacter oryzae]BDG04525.1 hypothetical protein AMOR_35210 [Anaeromyxobacter oryzae]
MALTSTLYHLDLHLSHVDRGIDQALVLKAARHPSETMERVWLRVLALLWQWEDRIEFGPGLCEPDAPDVAAARLDGTPSLVVRVGKPEPARIARDVSQNAGARVAVLFESPRRMEAFLTEAAGEKLGRVAQAELAAVEPALLAELSARDDRRIRSSVTIVADHFYVERDGRTVDGPLHRGRFGAGAP